MQSDFHYYATYCAAFLAGFSHKECMDICYSAQFVDCCSATYLRKIKAPVVAATTQLSLEMMDADKDLIGLQDITRIWASFHFLPYDLYADVPNASKRYKHKFRLICKPNGKLLEETVNLAKDKSLQAIGLSMHVLADTWAHQNFAGTPSFVINNTSDFYELLPKEGGGFTERHVKFRNSAFKPDDLLFGLFTNTMYQPNENAIMNLGHGRAGHFPDYSFARYKYLPAWNNYEEILKDNPSDYFHAFCQMVYAFEFFKNKIKKFEKDNYAFDTVKKHEEKIKEILSKRQLDSSQDWKLFGQSLSNEEIEPFDIDKYAQEYVSAKQEDKNSTFLGKFILAALAQKSMVTNRIFKSKNPLAGISVDYDHHGLKGIKAYFELVKQTKGEQK